MKKLLVLLLSIVAAFSAIISLTACGDNVGSGSGNSGTVEEGQGGSSGGEQGDTPAHTHVYTKQVATEEYLKQAATCTAKAKYYFSCECGEKGTETFEYGDKLPHTFDKQVVSELYIKSSATCAKKAEYYYSCACGEKGTETFEYGDKLPHTFDKQVVSKLYIKSSATCMTKAEYYYSCECGEKGTETFVDENGKFSTEVHPYEDVWYNDEQFHYHKSSCSHAVVKDKTAHSFGESDTCTVCGRQKTSTGLRFTYDSNYDGYILTGIGTCKDLDIIVPSDYNGKPVVRISNNAISNSSITSIIIPDSVIEIEKGAFRYCSTLESITLPFIGASKTAENAYEQVFGYIFGYEQVNNQTRYDGATFQYGNYIFNPYGSGYYGACYHYWIPNSLKTVVITNVTKINNYAFNNCSKLTSITLPDGLKEIKRNAFSNCTSLKNITIPDGVTSIGSSAFSGCSSLMNATIPDCITYIGSSAFSGCSSLMNATIPDCITYIGSDAFSDCNALIYNEYGNGCYLGNGKNNYVVFVKSKSKNISSCSINEKCKIIGYDAFSGCSGLMSITIPDSITYIGSDAFSGCGKLTSVYYIGSIDEWVQIDFGGSDATPLYYAKYLYVNNDLVTEANITAATKINDYAFSYYRNLTSVTIGNNVTSIGSGAFYNCSGLTSLTIGNSVTSIDSSAFSGCSGLTSIKIPDGVTSIGSSAFSGCSGLTSIKIPDSVTSIGFSAFYNCSGLTSVKIPDSVTSIGSSAFSYCSGLTSLTIGNSVTSIGKEVFHNCSGLTSLTIGNSVTSIDEYAFKNCSGLTSLTIGNSVTSIGNGAFSYCSSLTSVVWNAENCTKAGSIDYLNYLIFYKCSQLSTITIGDNVKTIPNHAFYYCDGLTSVYYIGSIDEWVQIDFGGSNATPLYYAKYLYVNNDLVTEANITAATKINDYAFSYYRNLTSVTIGNSVTSIGSGAFYNCSSLTSVVWNAENCIEAGSYNNPIFYKCSELSTITIGDNVKTIPVRAFV